MKDLVFIIAIIQPQRLALADGSWDVPGFGEERGLLPPGANLDSYSSIASQHGFRNREVLPSLPLFVAGKRQPLTLSNQDGRAPACAETNVIVAHGLNQRPTK